MQNYHIAIALTALLISCTPKGGVEPVAAATTAAIPLEKATVDTPVASQGVRCGTAICTGATPYCRVAKEASDDAKCVAETRGGPDHHIIQCRTPRDCKPGMHCNVGMGGTWCSTMTQNSTYTIVCDRDEECLPLDKEIPLTTPRKCVHYGVEALKGCLGDR